MKQSWGPPSIVYLVHTVYAWCIWWLSPIFLQGVPVMNLNLVGGAPATGIIFLSCWSWQWCSWSWWWWSWSWFSCWRFVLRSNWGDSAAQYEWARLHHPCRAPGILILLIITILAGTTDFYHNSYHHCNVIITTIIITIIIMVLLTRRHYWTSQCTTLWSDRLTSLTLPWTTSGHNFSSLIKDERMTSSWYRESTDQETGSKDTSFKGSRKPQNLYFFGEGDGGYYKLSYWG